MLALTRLGHEAYFFEDSDDYPSCYNPDTNAQSTDPTYGLQFLSSTLGELGLPERWAYYDAHKAVWRGPCADRALDICATADLFLNVSAVNPIRPWLMDVPVRVLVDTGRPVLIQDIGFGEWLRASEGVLPFRTVEDVLAGFEAINGQYRAHCDAARAVAETYFNAPAVLTRLLELAIHPETRRPPSGVLSLPKSPSTPP